MKLTIKNIITSLIFQITTIICGFIVPKLIISNYGSNVNGLVTSITQFLAYITLLEAGFGPVIKANLYKPLSKKTNKNKEEIQRILKASEKIFRRLACIFLIYIIILSIIYPIIVSKEFNSIYTISLILIISISSFVEYYFGTTYQLFLHADQKPYVTYIIQTITLILNTISIIVLVKLGTSIQIVKLVSAIIFIFRPIVHNIYVKKKYNISLKNVKDDYVIKQKWDALFQHIAYIAHNNTDIIVLTLCRNIKEVSVYSVYMVITNGIKSIVSCFTGGIYANFGKLIAKKEIDTLNKKFKIFVNIYYTISSIIFISSLFLIVPFVKLYTRGITDANYIRPVFAYLMVLSKFVLILREPYHNLVLAAGHFKQTKNGALLEAIINIVLSFILVFKYGLIGVAIGTLVALIIRTIELMYYASKNILKVSITYILKRIIIIILEVILIIFVINLIDKFIINSYLNWIIYALVVTGISSIIIISINTIVNIKLIKNYKK